VVFDGKVNILGALEGQKLEVSSGFFKKLGKKHKKRYAKCTIDCNKLRCLFFINQQTLFLDDAHHQRTTKHKPQLPKSL